MKAKLTINGKEFKVEISDDLIQAMTETKKKTGYERVAQGEIYYLETDDGTTDFYEEYYADEEYEGANYYSDETVAKNNARADRLYRQLRRFAVEHRDNEIDWNNKDIKKYVIYYIHNALCWGCCNNFHYFGSIYFDNYKTAQDAIDKFHDELIWYFTEYKDSL